MGTEVLVWSRCDLALASVPLANMQAERRDTKLSFNTYFPVFLVSESCSIVCKVQLFLHPKLSGEYSCQLIVNINEALSGPTTYRFVYINSSHT